MTKRQSDITGLLIGAAYAAVTGYMGWLLWMSWRGKDPCGCKDSAKAEAAVPDAAGD